MRLKLRAGVLSTPSFSLPADDVRGESWQRREDADQNLPVPGELVQPGCPGQHLHGQQQAAVAALRGAGECLVHAASRSLVCPHRASIRADPLLHEVHRGSFVPPAPPGFTSSGTQRCSLPLLVDFCDVLLSVPLAHLAGWSRSPVLGAAASFSVLGSFFWSKFRLGAGPGISSGTRGTEVPPSWSGRGPGSLKPRGASP